MRHEYRTKFATILSKLDAIQGDANERRAYSTQLEAKIVGLESKIDALITVSKTHEGWLQNIQSTMYQISGRPYAALPDLSAQLEEIKDRLDSLDLATMDRQYP